MLFRSLEGERAEAICRQLAHYDYLYLSGISLAILSPASRDKLLTLLRQCRANGGKVIFDNNYRPRLWASKEETRDVYNQMLGCTDIAFLTLDDEDALWGEKPVEEVIHRTQAAGVREVVVKRGADSCLVAIQGQPIVDVPAVKLPKENVVDTTAAGDTFCGYFLSGITKGREIPEILKTASAASAIAVSRNGAAPSIPEYEEVEKFVAERG